MPNLRGKASAKKLRKLIKEKRARAKAMCSVDERHNITAEPVLRSSASVECSGGVLNEGLCDVVTEQEVISGSVCDHNPELCDVTEYVVPSVADDADPFVLSDPPKKLDAFKDNYNANHEEKLDATKDNYIANREERLDAAKDNYIAYCQERLNAFKDNYIANHEERLEAFKDNYIANRQERLEDGCFDDDNEESLSKDAEKDVQNDNVVTSDTKARYYDEAVNLIDQALSEGDVDALIKIATESDPNNKMSDVTQIFTSRYDESDSDINLRDPDLEVKLLKENVNLIAEFQKEISNQNEHACCSCRRLMRRGNLTKVFANASVVGESRAEDVVRVIDKRVSCNIPNKDTCPQLHEIVMRYQLHKCSNYFSKETVLKNVQQSMKAEKRIYHPKRSEEEVRVNDYNPLLLLLWKANMDVSFYQNEDELVYDGETVQEAFDRRHIVEHERCVEANEKFRKLLKCREKLKDIQDARAANREQENDVEDDDPQLMGQIKDAKNDVRDMDTGSGLYKKENRY
uniref:Uncharacterized protein n=1 Tax=Amphimedon queenslandica TaxID=400682 RepID=A0A1X7UF82_AMPQE